MILFQRTRLKYLLESSSGIHFTSYLENSKDLFDIRRQLKEALSAADEYLYPVMNNEEKRRFLEPIYNLFNNIESLANMRGNIGLFRNQKVFRIVNVPIALEFSYSIATSFHVKPLLRWLQRDQDFLIIGLRSDEADLYLGNRSSLKMIKSFEPSPKNIHDLMKTVGRPQPKIYVLGRSFQLEDLLKDLNYSNIYPHPIPSDFNEEQCQEVAKKLRKELEKEEIRNLDNALFEYRLAKKLNLTANNIFTIAKEVSRGKVRKLIVANELNIFGKFDKKTGQLTVHPFDLDHEDDDVLDDLAQAVLEQGAEVIVAPRSQILEGKAALAILDYSYKDEGIFHSCPGQIKIPSNLMR